jgi:hypothetical protein
MRSRNRWIWILLAAVAFLLVVAVIAGAVYLILQRQPAKAGSWQDPISAIVVAEIRPEWALYPLAGASEVETIDVAIGGGYLETAYAGLVFSLELADVQRIGRLTLLASRFVEAEKPDRAARCYQQIYDAAILSPKLNDPARADALLAVGNGWAALGEESLALNAYDQVYLLAVQSPGLQMAHRRDLLGVLESAYRDLGDEAQAEAARQQIQAWDQGAQPQPLTQPSELVELPAATEPISSPDVGALEEMRRQAVYNLIQALGEGREPAPDLVAAVAQALQDEDAAKLALYQQELAATSQPSKRINVDWHLIRWLMIKYQVATQGFGLSLVPEWEAQEAEIQSALSVAYEDLRFDYEDLVTALPEASLMGPGSYLARRQVILAGQLGQYPNYPAQQMASKLQDAVTELISAGSREQLYVDVAAGNEGLYFFLSPADQYGLRAPPP